MAAPDSPHPSDRTLSEYGLGKLDDESASAVHDHLEVCPDCRQRAGGVTSDSFLGRFRDARSPSSRSIPDGTLDGGTMSFAGAKPASPPPPTDTLPPGLADHPDYEIRRELGRGGMGVVYLAHNTMMGRDEVLKVMGRHIIERPGVLERFQREIRAVARFRHPNIVAAYHAFRIEGGLVFSMEYVEGLDLARLVKTKGPLSVAHATYFTHQAALGLQHAHEKGLIHRDIKPHNLMLTHDGKARVIKVLDFGLAKATREEKVDGGLTSEGQALGTPDYIAPEQIINALGADIRADLYSLGGTLFYLLTGRPPFQANSLYDMYQAHISRDAEPLNLIRPEVPAELAALVAKMMAKDPKRRFQTPGEVAQALMPFFKFGAARVRPETSQVEAARDRPSMRVVEKPGPAQNAAPPVDRVKGAAEPLEAGWDRLVDGREPEAGRDEPLRALPSGHPRRKWAAASAAALLGALLIAWLAGVFKVKTADGVIVLENVPQDAEVQVDGRKVTFTWAGDDKPVEIGIVPGEHRVRVEKDGFKAFGGTVTIAKAGREEVTVRLEPMIASPSLTRTAEKAPDAAKVPSTSVENTPRTAPGPEIPGEVSLRSKENGMRVVGDEIILSDDVITLDGLSLSSYVLTFEAKIIEGANGFGVFFHNNASGDCGIVSIGDEGNTENNVAFRVKGEYHIPYGMQKKARTESGHWYEARLTVHGPEVRFSLDGKEWFHCDDKRFSSGWIGFGTDETVAHFRRIRITTPDNKPIWEGPTEGRASGILLAGVPRDADEAATRGELPRGAEVVPGASQGLKEVPETTRIRSMTNSIGMKLNLIPPGEFLMGPLGGELEAETDEKPRHLVRITRPFFMGIYEVTQEEYRAVMDAQPSHHHPDGKLIDTSRHPVESVSWLDAAAFCNRLSLKEGLLPCYAPGGERIEAGTGYRLPTEAEWEYACRAGTTTAFSTGERLSVDEANINGDVKYNGSAKGPWMRRTVPVGSYPPNSFGLFDMHGNVWEWCSDWYSRDYYQNSPVDDPPGLTKLDPSKLALHVYRGGEYYAGPASARSANRDRDQSRHRTPTIGFRVLRTGATPEAATALDAPKEKAPRNLPAEAPRVGTKPATGLVPAPLGPGLHAFVVDGNWSVEGDALIQRNTDSESAIVLLGDAEHEEFDLSFRAKVVTGDRFLALFGYSGPGKNWQVESGDTNGRETSLKWYHDGGEDIVEHEPGGVSRDREYAMLIQVRKGGCRVIRDQKTVLLYEDRGFGKGRIGLGTWRSSVRFRDIAIRTPDGKSIWKGKFELAPKEAQARPPIEPVGPAAAGKVVAATPPGGTAGKRLSPQDARVARVAALNAALEKPIPLKYPGGVPLGKLIDAIRTAAGEPGGPALPVYVDPLGVADADKTLDSKITIDLEGSPLKITLRRALKQLGLDYCNKEGVLFVSEIQMARDEVDRVGRVPTDGKPASRKVLDALERPIPMRFPRATSIGEVANYLRKAVRAADDSGYSIDIDPQGLQDADKDMNSPIRIDLDGIPLRVTLDLLLRQLGMGYYIEDGILTISAPEVYPPSMKNQR